MSEQEQYRKIAKNTAVLGGAQVVQMLVTLVRTKVIAVLLGPTGMGVNALILSAITTIQQFSSLGIFQSGVRDLSHTYNNDNAIKFARLRKIFNRLTLLSGLLGLTVCLVLSGILSEFSFGNSDYTWSFAAVSITLLFMSLHSGKTAILQATQNLKLIAKATIVGAVLNLVITVPMFYLWKMNGIVPAIVSSYFIFYLVNKYFEGKVIFATVDAPTKVQFIASSKPIIKLGVVLMVSNLMIFTFTFLLNGFISHFGSLQDVGLFQSAASICMQSMVIMNVTLLSDYYPRISVIHNDAKQFNQAVNNQAEIMLLLVCPISVLLIVFAPLIVNILLSSEFIETVPLIQMMAIALGLRMIWTMLGLAILAKGDTRSYLIFDAVTGNGLNFILNITMYYFYGLKGLGISYVLGSFVMIAILLRIVAKKYNITPNRRLVVLFFVISAVVLFVFYTASLFTGISYYIILSLLSTVIVLISAYKLYRKITQL